MTKLLSAVFLSLSLVLGICVLNGVRLEKMSFAAAGGHATTVNSQSASGDSALVDKSPMETNDELDEDSASYVSGWRRTESGWVQTDSWITSSSSTRETPATRLHPGLIAAFVVLVSIGGLLAFDPAIRRRRERLIKSDQTLIRNWGRQLRESADSYDGL